MLCYFLMRPFKKLKREQTFTLMLIIADKASDTVEIFTSFLVSLLMDIVESYYGVWVLWLLNTTYSWRIKATNIKKFFFYETIVTSNIAM